MDSGAFVDILLNELDDEFQLLGELLEEIEMDQEDIDMEPIIHPGMYPLPSENREEWYKHTYFDPYFCWT